MGGANSEKPAAVLVSGGVDSAVLVAELCERYSAVYPLFVQSGLIWEAAELEHLRCFLTAVARPELQPLRVFDMPVGDVYGDHWAMTGDRVPGSDSPDAAVYLPGRNLLLIPKASVWCVLNNVSVLALGSLDSNPFPDSTPEFDEALGQLVRQAVDGSLEIIRPYRHLNKAAVLRRGKSLPLQLTFSCINPERGEHCGVCNKCAERRRGFEAAGFADMTVYVHSVK
jgi:7-cyano-7-deazaguanine synthase